MCRSGYPTYPKILPPTLNFFFQSLKKTWLEKYNKPVHLKKKTKGLCILKDFFF